MTPESRVKVRTLEYLITALRTGPQKSTDARERAFANQREVELAEEIEALKAGRETQVELRPTG